MNKAHQNQLLIGLLITVNVLFAGYFLVLAWFSRFHYDDLHFLWKLKEMSIGGYVSDMYVSRSGRFIAYALNGIVFKTILLVGEHRFFPILFGFVGFFSVWIIAKYLLNSISRKLVFLSVMFAYNFSILTNIDFAVFNWLCAMSYYWLAPLLVLLVHLIIKQKLTVAEWFLFILISVFLGGGQEAFTPIVMICVFFYAIYTLKNEGFSLKNSLLKPQFQKSLISLIILLVCLIVVVVAPGNYARLAADEFSSPKNVMEFIIGIVKAVGMFSYYQFFYIPYYLILALIFCYIGFVSKNSGQLLNLSYRKLMLISSVLFLIYLLLSVLPSVYLWNGFGIQRNYTHVVFMLVVFISFQAFIFGYFKIRSKHNVKLTAGVMIGLVVMIGIMTNNIIQDGKSANRYATSVDNRIEYLELLQKQGVKEVVEVAPIEVPITTDPKYFIFNMLGKKSNPQPVLYYISDTETEPNEYASHLKKVYQFDFLIKLQNH